MHQLVGEKHLEVKVQNTFVHLEVPELGEEDVDEEQQPEVRRAFTTPVTWFSELSTHDDDEDLEEGEQYQKTVPENRDPDCSPQPCRLRINTHDPFEAIMVCKESSVRSIRRMATHDHFESPANLAQPYLSQMEVQDPFQLSAEHKQPAFKSMEIPDDFDGWASSSIAAAQWCNAADYASYAAELAQVQDEQLYLASPNWVPSPAEMRTASDAVQPLVSDYASYPAALAQVPDEQLYLASASWVPSPAEMKTASEAVQPLVGQKADDRGDSAQPRQAGDVCGMAPSGKKQLSRTTIMLRNLPNNYTQAMLLELIDQAGLAGKYDFLYLPIDFRTHAALGYAFVNLVSPEDAERLREFFDGFSGWALPSSKVCSAAWSHPHQGYEAHVHRYRNSPLMHETVPDTYRPILFADGVRIPFPPPTKKIKPPRQGTERMLV